MKFGVFTHVPWPEGHDAKAVVDKTVEEIQVAEEMGFVSAWMAEHHFTRYSMASSPLMLLGQVAAKTRSIRLGTAVLIPPLHHPIRLAEDTATLDLLSGGRVDVAFGRGTFGYEYGGFGMDASQSQERFQEAVSVIKGLWTTPEYGHSGTYYTLDRVNLVPVPLQKPHPPVYIAATRTPATLDYAVSTGHSLCIAVVQDTAASLDLCRRFVVRSKEAGFGVPMSGIPFFRYFYVAESEEQAVRDTEARLTWVADIMQWRNFLKSGSEVYQSMEEWRRTRPEKPATYEYLREHRAIIGTPDQCAARIQALRDEGVGYFGCNFDFGGMEHEKVIRSMELFKREVMPRFA